MGYKGWENYNPRAPKPDPKRQLQGQRSRELGETLENCIETACAVYRFHHLADVEKTPEPIKVIGPKHKLSNGAFGFECIFTKPAQPDFKGTLRGGRSVVFDAKASNGDTIQQSVVTDKQAEALTSHSELGAVAFVLVSLSLRNYYRVPWSIWKDMKAMYGRKYMTAAELEVFRIPFKNGFLPIFKDLEVPYEISEK